MMTPHEVWRWCIEAIRRLFTTPIQGWTWGQWFLALFLLSLISSCFSRLLCCARGRRRRYYYRDGRNRTYDDEDYHNSYHAYNNHPGGRLVQSSSIPMQTRPAQAPPRQTTKHDPPALAPYHQTV